jgi:hypothetical protein
VAAVATRLTANPSVVLNRPLTGYNEGTPSRAAAQARAINVKSRDRTEDEEVHRCRFGW